MKKLLLILMMLITLAVQANGISESISMVPLQNMSTEGVPALKVVRNSFNSTKRVLFV